MISLLHYNGLQYLINEQFLMSVSLLSLKQSYLRKIHSTKSQNVRSASKQLETVIRYGKNMSTTPQRCMKISVSVRGIRGNE